MRSIQFPPIVRKGSLVCKVPVLDASLEGFHDAVLVLGVVAEVPHIQDAGDCVGFPRPRRSTDEHKGHGLAAFSHIQMPCSCLLAPSTSEPPCKASACVMSLSLLDGPYILSAEKYSI